MDTATLSCEWTNHRAGSQLNRHTYDDARRSIFCVNRDRLIFEVHQIISRLLRDFFIFSSKKWTFSANWLFWEKEDLICVVFSKKSVKRTKVRQNGPSWYLCYLYFIVYIYKLQIFIYFNYHTQIQGVLNSSTAYKPEL